MFSFPAISEIRFTKLIIHSIFTSVALTLLTLLIKDLIGLVLGHPIEKDVSYISTILFVVWFVFAIHNERYQKQR
ncbi:hypothetical protein [Virgibacillus sp. SK37]|uniref:hypothetical protein n=1 Tax=Virgibacillus sp. SK37 TaxID=403957 RepID=UPI0004D15A1A|nr:hypothetical protein [Virgibacillus sp. SK37]AIF45255.1 hypothetical protein X953_06030 [Virgibacillus sp. SK37]